MVQQWLSKATSQSHEAKNMHISIIKQGQKKATQYLPEKKLHEK